jgi:hypothetical protein
MKIGFSLGRCVRDIVNGEVNIDDVVVVITQTMCHTSLQLHKVIEQYLTRTGYLKGLDVNECHYVARRLWDQGKIHQPRCLGADVKGVPEQSIWRDLVERPVMLPVMNVGVYEIK